MEAMTPGRMTAPAPHALFLVGLTKRLWMQFQKIHKALNSSPITVTPNQVLFVADSFDVKTQKLVAGCIIYESDGPWLMAENLVANPEFSPHVRFAAIDIILSTTRAMATARGMWIIACPSVKSLWRFLVRRGFYPSKAVVVSSPPGLVIPQPPRPKRFTRKQSSKKQRAR